jgi:excisionase family DNA binding protein
MTRKDAANNETSRHELVLALPVVQVAPALGVSARTIRRWIKAGKLQAIRPGGPNAPLLVLAWSLNELLSVQEGGSEAKGATRP